MSINADQTEIEKFAMHANDWWTKDGSMKALHEVNPLRMAFITDHVDIAGKTILDVGCGGGILTESLAKAGAKVTGLDLAEESINVAAKHAKKNKLKIKYLHQSIEELVEQNPKPFDMITCLEMLEHVPDPSATVEACSKLVKPGGHVFFSTLNRCLKAYVLAVVGAEYVLNLLPRGTHDYNKFIKPSELDAWCRQSDLTMKHIKGISYNPLTANFSISNDVSVNYLAYFVKNV